MNINETRSQLEIMNGNKMQEKKVWKLVLTGGPCGGKTTGETEIIFLFQCRLEDYFFLFLIGNNYSRVFFIGFFRSNSTFNIFWKPGMESLQGAWNSKYFAQWRCQIWNNEWRCSGEISRKSLENDDADRTIFFRLSHQLQ